MVNFEHVIAGWAEYAWLSHCVNNWLWKLLNCLSVRHVILKFPLSKFFEEKLKLLSSVLYKTWLAIIFVINDTHREKLCLI